jgi:hypothetical protein
MSVLQGINAIKNSAYLTSFAHPIMIVEVESAKEIFASPKDHAKLIKTVRLTRFAKKIIASKKMDVVWILIASSMNLARITNVYGHLAKKMWIAKRTTNVSMSNVLQKNVIKQDIAKRVKIVMDTFVFPNQINVKMIKPAQRMNCVHHFITIVEKYANKLVIVGSLKFALRRTIARKRIVTKTQIAQEIMNALGIVALISSVSIKKTAKMQTNMTVSKVDVMKLNA